MYAEFGFAREGACRQLSVVTPEKTATQQSGRRLGWGLFCAVGLALFVLAYRKHRSESRQSASGGGK
jgi:hypothetical protein